MISRSSSRGLQIPSERVTKPDSFELVQPHLCYLCSKYAIEPYQCLNKVKGGPEKRLCEAIFCLACLELYLGQKVICCPKCRTKI